MPDFFSILQSSFTETFSNTVSGLIQFLPRLANGLFLLLVGWILAKLISTVVTRLLAKFGLDNVFEQSNIDRSLEKTGLSLKPSTVLGGLIYWIILLSFLLAAIDAFGLESAANAINQLINYIPNIIGAVLVMIGGGLLARLANQTTQSLAAGANLEFHRELGTAARYLVLALTVLIAIGQLGFDVAVLGTLLVNVLTILAATLGLAFALGGRHVVQNILAGFYAKEMFTLGQPIEVQSYSGTLEAIGTLKSTIASDHQTVTIPNSTLIADAVISQNSK